MAEKRRAEEALVMARKDEARLQRSKLQRLHKQCNKGGGNNAFDLMRSVKTDKNSKSDHGGAGGGGGESEGFKTTVKADLFPVTSHVGVGGQGRRQSRGGGNGRGSRAKKLTCQKNFNGKGGDGDVEDYAFSSGGMNDYGYALPGGMYLRGTKEAVDCDEEDGWEWLEVSERGGGKRQGL